MLMDMMYCKNRDLSATFTRLIEVKKLKTGHGINMKSLVLGLNGPYQGTETGHVKIKASKCKELMSFIQEETRAILETLLRLVHREEMNNCSYPPCVYMSAQ